MIYDQVIDKLGITCPDKGSFYVCDDKPTKFIGCCTVDPCKTTTGDCPDGNLTAASFHPNSYQRIEGQDCVSGDPKVQWFSCAETSPPFLGCCSGNPCTDGGCKGSNLSAAVLNPDDSKAAAFLPDDYNQSKGLSAGAKAGIAVGCVVAGLAIIGLAAWWFWRRRKQKKQQQSREVVLGEKSRKSHSNHTSHMSSFNGPPPTPGHIYSPATDVNTPGPDRSTVYDPYGREHVVGSPTVSALTSNRSTFISGYEPSAPSISPYEGYSSSQPIPPMPSPSPNQWHPSMYNSDRQSQVEAYPYALNAISPMPTGIENAYYSPQQFDQHHLQPMTGVPMPQVRQQHVAELPVMMESEGVASAGYNLAPPRRATSGKRGRA